MSRESDRRFTTGMVIDRKYALLRLLGEGGVGSVFEAQNTWTGRRVAIKVLHPVFSRKSDIARRFLREAQTATQLAHPNIVEVLDMGQESALGALFIVQEFLDGADLRHWLEHRKKLAVLEALDVVVPIMGAVIAMHARGVVHRDIKPENIFLARDASGEIVPKLIDFGLSKVVHAEEDGVESTRAGTLLGTPHYMSPEQATGDASLDARTDVWSAGVVLYEALCGRPPFDDAAIATVLGRIVTEPPPRIETFAPEIPRGLADVIHRGVEPDRARRYATMRAFVRALLDCPAVRGEALGALFAVRYRQAIPDVLEPADDITAPIRRGLQALSAAPPPVKPVSSMPPPAPAPVVSSALDDDDATDVHEAPRLAAMHVTQVAADDDDDVPDFPSVTELDVDDERTSPDAMNAGDTDRPPRPDAGDTAQHLAAAEDALARNALAEALALARATGDAAGPDEALRGAAALVQAVAHTWRGDAAAAAPCAETALATLAPGSPAWTRAAGALGVAYGGLGHVAPLRALAEQLRARPHDDARYALVGPLLDTDQAALAEKLLGEVPRDRGSVPTDTARAWLQQARGEMALYAGDIASYLALSGLAAEGFAAAGAAREACERRVATGHALALLGAYHEAEQTLRDAVAFAAPPGLYVADVARLWLGVVRAYQGALPEARALAERAAQAFARRGDARREAHALAYAAAMALRDGEPARAARVAREAVQTAERWPAARAHALAVLTDALRSQGSLDAALATAGEAVALADRASPRDTGEAEVRLAYAEVLDASGRAAEACIAIVRARRRLQVRAQQISDPGFRRSFLHAVPEHARTIALARAWLGDTA